MAVRSSNSDHHSSRSLPSLTDGGGGLGFIIVIVLVLALCSASFELPSSRTKAPLAASSRPTRSFGSMTEAGMTALLRTTETRLSEAVSMRNFYALFTSD